MLSIADALEPEPGVTFAGRDEEIRSVSVQRIEAQGAALTLFEKLMRAINGMNNYWWRFDISLLTEIEVLRYEVGDHYVSHTDWGGGFQTRKLSAVIMLSDPSDYDGGDLAIHDRAEPSIVPNERGTIVTFPSWSLHGVSPVTRGVRRSATAWVKGPVYR